MSPADQPRLLPLFTTTNPKGGRSSITCRYRCGNACAHEAPNTSDNQYFADVVADVVSRRRVLKAGAVIAVAGAGAATVGVGSAVATPSGHGNTGLDFQPVAPNDLDAIVAPPGYEQGVVIRWGDPVVPSAPRFDFANQTAAAQAKQFGFNNDFCGLVPIPGHRDRWLMVSNHEYTTESAMFYGYDEANPTREQAEIAWAAHGLSVVAVEEARRGGLEVKLDRHYNRRITLTTPFTVRGPAAGSKYLRTSADPTGRTVLGTLNNCSGGVTPWGTILSGEENFNQYLANADSVDRPGREGTQHAVRRHRRRVAAQVGAVRQAVRPRAGTQRGQPVRLGRRDRPAGPVLDAGEAHRARPVQARGRERHRRPRRPRGRVHG